MQEERLIDSYESISILTEKMVNAASARDLEGLIELELACRTRVEALKKRKEGVIMDSRDQKQKVEVIKKILADDARIRELTEPWMNSLHSILTANRKGKLIARAYKPDNRSG
ncbi:MAG: flagellar protein FliT [Thiobacillaceae bacterium]|jgi:flagellar protein FliT